jgi:hypothetical protein
VQVNNCMTSRCIQLPSATACAAALHMVVWGALPYLPCHRACLLQALTSHAMTQTWGLCSDNCFDREPKAFSTIASAWRQPPIVAYICTVSVCKHRPRVKVCGTLLYVHATG